MEQCEIENTLSTTLLTVSTVANILHVSKVQVYRLIECGKLEAVDIGAGNQRPGYRVKSSSVNALLGDMH